MRRERERESLCVCVWVLWISWRGRREFPPNSFVGRYFSTLLNSVLQLWHREWERERLVWWGREQWRGRIDSRAMEAAAVRESAAAVGDGWGTYSRAVSNGLEEFTRSSTSRRGEQDDEEALKWAALQKLPTYDRIRTAILKNTSADLGGKISHQEFDVTKISYEVRQQLISNLLRQIDDDNERFLRKTRERIDRYESKF